MTIASLDYAIPYNLMVGTWTGHSILYGQDGSYLHTGPSLLAIYWKEPGKVMHYKQADLGNLDDLTFDHPHKEALGQIIFMREFDLLVDGKACHSSGGPVAVKGAESQPGIYLFELNFPQGTYYNNQYFNQENERHIIGPFVPKGETSFSAVVSQTFSRVSYDVIDSLR